MKLIYWILFIAFSLPSQAQEKSVVDRPAYPQDYFRNPLDIPIYLAGNFGECRPGHFHSGIDIKTLGKENQPVHAAADGYISRIKMEKGGFGHGLYITHPNGYTTLYAHLNDFVPELQRYLKKEQYAKHHWDVDIQLTPGQFPVKKGQQIAWSGNTGASTAPHLHFEIRDTKTEHPLNPELFGLPIIDNIPPSPAEIVVYAADGYGTGFYEQPRFMVALKKVKESYVLAKAENENVSDYNVKQDTLILNEQGNVGIGVNVDDHMDGSDNTIAFYKARLFFDDSLQAEIILDDIGYDETRYINAYADYKLKQMDNKWVQCFFKLPGNHLDKIYSYLNGKQGRLLWEDGAAHKINIQIADDIGNQSSVFFYVRSRNAIIVRPADHPSGFHATDFFAGKVNSYTDSNIAFSLDGKQLYDNIAFIVKATTSPSIYSDKYQLHYPYVPVHHYFDLGIRPGKIIKAELTRKVVMMYSDGKDEDGRAAALAENGWYKAKVRNFGTYWLDIDTTPPVIKSIQKNGANLSKAKQVTFEVKDEMTSVRTFSGYLDGKWICFEQHNDLFFYKFDEHCPRGKHKLVFKAEDENGNTSTVNLTFTR